MMQVCTQRQVGKGVSAPGGVSEVDGHIMAVQPVKKYSSKNCRQLPGNSLPARVFAPESCNPILKQAVPKK
jgi:hypothetical protein